MDKDKITDGDMETMEECEDENKESSKVGDKATTSIRVGLQPQIVLPGSAQSYFMQGFKQPLLHHATVHRLYQLLLLENWTPNQIILTNRRIPDRYVRWCERTVR